MIPDDVYVHKTVEGDAEAFNELVNRHHSKIYGLAYRMLGNREDAADATQETFLEAYKSINAFRFQSQFGTWLYRIGINTCQQYIRKSQSHDHKLTAYTREAEIYGIASDEDSPERSALKDEQDEMVQGAINRLPPKQREVVTLYYMQHLKYREIAEVLNCSEGTVGIAIESGIEKSQAETEQILSLERRCLNELRTDS